MPHFSKSIRVPYTGEQAFDLVSDIRAYPDFIKWITAMRVSDEVREADGGFTCIGDAVVGFTGSVERFSPRVVGAPQAGKVTASLVKGPFRKLKAEWRISSVDRGGTDIALDIDYDFKNPFIGMLAAANHDLAVNKILAAFLEEASRRYGKAAPF